MIFRQFVDRMSIEVDTMNTERKKQLSWEYKNRKPEMGVISFCCVVTNERFLGSSRDTQADLNSNSFKLTSGRHPNKRLQELWNQHGKKGFELSVLQCLEYEDPTEDHTSELEELLKECLEADSTAMKIWR